MHSVCLCTVHQNAVLLVDALNWYVTYKDLINKIVCDSANRECMMHRCENCPGQEAQRNFLNEELNEFDEDKVFHYMQWETTDRATLQTIAITCSEYIEKVTEDINTLTKHYFL